MRHLEARLVAAVVLALAAGGAARAATEPAATSNAALRKQLVAEVGEDGAARVVAVLEKVDAPDALGELRALLSWQEAQGGGFYGLLPSPVPDSLPRLTNRHSRLEAALVLAKRRQAGRAALEKLGFPLQLRGATIPAPSGEAPPGMRVELDDAALTGFVDAMSDGRVTTAEAAALAALPANREMLRHRRDLGYVPEPLPTEASLARMIARAGSGRPLDRLWCWLEPESFFGYADLVDQLDGYRAMADELRAHGDRLETEAARRLAPYLPGGFTYRARFALTVGALVRGWTTAEMSGLNVEQLKDDWPRLVRTMSEEVYHRLQLRLVPTRGAGAAASFDDLVPTLGDPAATKLFEAVLYTVLEGTANLAAQPAAGVDDPGRAAEGAALLADLVDRVVRQGNVGQADALISKGLKGNGPLYALGYQLARLVADADGPGAIPEQLGRGPVAFALRAQAVAPDGHKPLTTDVVAALRQLPSEVEAAPGT